MPRVPATTRGLAPAALVPLPDDGLDRLVRRAQADYGEMPGLRLTLAQACRLWDIDPATCARLLQHLVAQGFVTVRERGVYVRRTTV